MKVRFWGTRGSIPSPLSPKEVEDKICQAILGLPAGLSPSDEPAVRAYVDRLPPLMRGTAGGNTPCTEIQAHGHTIILDAGSGLRPLGIKLMGGPCGRGKGRLHVFVSHTHWDHIQGFPFFRPAYVPGNHITFYSVHDLEAALEGQQVVPYFPIPLSYLKASRQFVRLQPGQPLNIGDVCVHTIKNPHPGDAYSFRFEDQHAVLVYASDSEFKQLAGDSLKPHLDFFREADVLIFDAQFALRENWDYKEDWGHSSAMIGVDMARAAGVKRLVLFHHEPAYSDADLATIQATAMDYLTKATNNPACEITMAYEGLELDLTLPGAAGWQLAPAGEAAILTPQRVFDERGVEQLAQHLADQDLDSVIDLSDVESLSMPGLRALLNLRQARHGRDIMLVAPSDSVRQVIQLAGYLDCFAIYPSIQVALAARQAREALNLPDQIIQAHYQIQDKLGENPLGISLKAIDIHTNQAVMLKVLSHVFSPETLERFMPQVTHLMRLDHPNIVRVLAWEREDQHIFQVTEYADGPTLQIALDQAVEAGRPAGFSIEQAVDILVGIARAVEYAHSHGVVHGSLAPDHIFLTEAGVKVSGFGWGRLVQGHNLLESPLHFLPAAHLSPEQILGQSPDARTDLYAMGVLAYHTLAGRLPFEGDDQAVMEAHLHLEPPQLRSFNPQVSLSLQHLVHKLLAKNPNDRYASAQQVRRILGSLATHSDESAPLYWGKLAGREPALETLLACWREAVAGHGQLVFVSGEQGVGKTALAHGAAAQSGAAVVLSGRGQALESSPAYHLFSQVLKGYLATVPPELSDEQMEQALLYLVDLAPEIPRMLPDRPEPPSLEPEQEHWRLMIQATQVVRCATRKRPWFVVLDDLQWADAGSLDLLRYLGQHLPDMRLLVVGTYRDEEVDAAHPLAKVLQDLSRHPTYRSVALGRLDEAGVDQMLAQLWPPAVPAGLVQKIYQHTGGTPFYVEEVAKGLVDEGLIYLQEGRWCFPPPEETRLPTSIHEAIWRRIAHLSLATQMLLRQAAVLGDVFRFDDLHSLSGLPAGQVLEHLDMALECQLVQELPGEAQWRFRHAEIQRVLYEDLGAVRRRMLHRQAAEALERRHWPHTKHVSADLAHHFYHAGELEQAIIYGFQAGRQAQATYDNALAMVWYRRALEMLDRLSLDATPEFQTIQVSVHQSLAEVLMLTSHYDQALEQCNLAKTLLEPSPATPRRARQLADVYRLTAQVHERRGAYNLALEWLDKALCCLDENEPSAERVSIYSTLGGVHMRQGHYEVARTWFEQALAQAGDVRHGPALHAGESLEMGRPALGQTVEAESLYGLGVVAWHLSDYDGALACGQRALEIYREMGDRGGQAQATTALGMALHRREDYLQAKQHFEQALSLYRDIGSRRGEGNALNSLGLVCCDVHEYGQAKRYCEQALHIGLEVSDQNGQSTALLNLGKIYAHLGDYGQARACYNHALDLGRDIGDQRIEAESLAYLGLLEHLQGDHAAAQQCSIASLSIIQAMNLPELQALAYISVGYALAGLGQWPQALESYRQAVSLYRELGQALKATQPLAGLADAHLAQGELAQAAGYVEDILGHIGWQGNPLYGLMEPLQVYMTCWRVLIARADRRAADIMENAYRLLQEQAHLILQALSGSEEGGAEEWQRSFLENVAANRDIVRAWQAQHIR